MYGCTYYSANGYAPRTLCAVLTNTSMYASSNPCKSSVPCGHGMAPLWGQGHDRFTYQVKQVFHSLSLKVENFGQTKLSGLGRCGLTFCQIASNYVGKRLLVSAPFRNSCCLIAQVKGENFSSSILNFC